METNDELDELFRVLSKTRISAARRALEVGSDLASEIPWLAALLPLAVDAALHGASELSTLARGAAALGESALIEQRARALDAVESALETFLGGGLEPEPNRTGAEHASQESSAEEPRLWQPTLSEDMVDAFLEECTERTDALGERLLELELGNGGSELVQAIFRDLHTLKGGSAFAGLAQLNRVAHRAEDLMGELRDGRREVTPELVDLLLATLDVLRAILDRARAREPIDVDVEPILQRLRNPDRARAQASPSGPDPALGTGVASAADAVSRKPVVSSTLRIDFDKVDQLLSLVGEVLLARSGLQLATETHGELAHDLSRLRKKLGSVREAAGLLEGLKELERHQLSAVGELSEYLGALSGAAGQLRDTVMRLRMAPISRLFTKYQRTARELARGLDKQVRVEILGADTELDKVLVERLEDPLLHLVRNAVDHGLETPAEREQAGKPRVGTLRLTASQSGGQVVLTVTDDGRGIFPDRLRQRALERALLSAEQAGAMSDAEALDLIFLPGFSTATSVSDVSGRGVGMDVVADAVRKLKGHIRLFSEVGSGTTVELRLPLTLAISKVLTVKVDGELVAIPLDNVVNARSVAGSELSSLADGVCIRHEDAFLPVVDLAERLGFRRDPRDLSQAPELEILIAQAGSEKIALLVERIHERKEVVVKSLGPLLASAPAAAGAAVIGDRVELVVDLGQLLERPGRAPPASSPRAESAGAG